MAAPGPLHLREGAMTVAGSASSPRCLAWQQSHCPRSWHSHVRHRTHTCPQRLCIQAAVTLYQTSTPHAHQPTGQHDVVPQAAATSKAKDARQQKHRTQNLAELGHNSHRVVLAYDGTAYRGWQLQLDEPTVQQEVERALMAIFKEPRTKLGVSAAGRTDTGVHAHGQCVQFFTDKEPDTTRVHLALNSHLPPNIRAMSAYRTAPDFHVTISAQAKTYRYHIETGRVHNPLTCHFKTHVPYSLDVHAMQDAAMRFKGKHNFIQFSNQSSDTARRNPVKVIHYVTVTSIDGGIQVEVMGTGFLYKQVRHMVGALIAVGRGQMSPDVITQSLTEPEAAARGSYKGWTVVPAKGLSLHHVHYPLNVDDPTCLLYPEYPHDEWGRLIFKVPDAEDGTE